MKRIITRWLVALMLAAQPIQAAVCVGFGQSEADPYTLVFSDYFTRGDSGTVGGSWDSETDTGSLLSVVSGALVWSGTDAKTAGYVSKDTGTEWNKYKVKMKLKVNTLTFPNGNGAQILSIRTASGNAIALYLKASSTAINNIYIQITEEDASIVQGNYPFTFIADTEHNFEVIVSTATATDSNDGTVEVKIDGASVYSATGLDTYTKGGRAFRTGMLYSDLAMTKIITIDDFEVLEAD